MDIRKQEHLVVWYLDVHYNVIEERVVFIGSVHRVWHVQERFLHYAVKNLARYVLVAHNHPSEVYILPVMILMLLRP